MAIGISISMTTSRASEQAAAFVSDNGDGTSTVTSLFGAVPLSLADNGDGTGTVSLGESAYAYSGDAFSSAGANYVS